MKKILVMALLLVGLSLAGSGVGYDGTLGGVSGLSLVTSIGDKGSVQSIVGYNVAKVDGTYTHRYGIGLRGWYSYNFYRKI